MIGPVSILSLAAVSAAESTSSGRRGLREPADWKLPAIVLGATVTVCLGGGILIGRYLIGGGSSGSYDLTVTANYKMHAVGCDNTHFQKNDDPAEKDTAPDCSGACTKNTRNANKFTPFGKTKEEDACTVCQANFYWKGKDGCATCGASITMPGVFSTASGDAETEDKVCFPACEANVNDTSGLSAGKECICRDSAEPSKGAAKCKHGDHTKCDTSGKKVECKA